MTSDSELLKLAHSVCENAYAPYSKFKVGACALYESGKYYLGCNVENASFGLSLCAERNAISSAIANGEKSKLMKIAIVSDNTSFCFPCGACRQWFSEFCHDDFEVIVEDDQKAPKSFRMSDILPNSFKL
ncbi:cytidine deaminase [bacterium]|nr:cytidine deaminase [bacterium]